MRNRAAASAIGAAAVRRPRSSLGHHVRALRRRSLPAARIGAEGYVLSLLSRVMILALAAMSLDLILGYGALVSFGHAAFLGIGAYAVGILSSHGSAALSIQIPAALAASARSRLVTGAISLRTKGVYFIMITLAFGQMLFFLATSLASYGGDDGMTLPGAAASPERALLESDAAFYWVCFACLLGDIRALAHDRGIALRPGLARHAREMVRMEAIGFYALPLPARRLCDQRHDGGLAGCLLANQSEFVSPAYMTWQRSGELIFMVVLGGLGTLHGAIIGAAAFLLLEEFLPEITPAASCCRRHPRAAGGELEDDLRPAADPRRAVCARWDSRAFAAGRPCVTPCWNRAISGSSFGALVVTDDVNLTSRPVSCTRSSARTAPARRR